MLNLAENNYLFYMKLAEPIWRDENDRNMECSRSDVYLITPLAGTWKWTHMVNDYRIYKNIITDNRPSKTLNVGLNLHLQIIALH